MELLEADTDKPFRRPHTPSSPYRTPEMSKMGRRLFAGSINRSGMAIRSAILSEIPPESATGIISRSGIPS
jgi:hypothetical protein